MSDKKIIFKRGSQPLTIYTLLSKGGSLTHEEAIPYKIGRLAQRMADMKKKYENADAVCPLMTIPVTTSNGIKITRYFFRGCGCVHESNPMAKAY